MPPAQGPVRAGAPLDVSDANGRRRYSAPELRGLRRQAGRARPHGSFAVGSERAAAVRHARRNSRLAPSQRALDVEPARRTLGDVPSRVRRAPVLRRRCRRRAPRCATSSGASPTRSSARPSSTRSTAATPISPRCRCTAPRSRSRTSSTRATCARPAAPTSATRWTRRPRTRRSSPSCARRAPSSTRRPTCRSTTAAPATRAEREDHDAHVRRRRPQHLGRHGLQRLRSSLRDRRVELRLGGIGRREPRHMLDLRGDRRLVPPAGVAQRRRRRS